MKNLMIVALLIVIGSCAAQPEKKRETQEMIIQKYLKTGAWHYDMFSQEWQERIDAGLRKDSTIAYLWQQKAMPLFKQGKIDLGMKYLDKAVKFDSAQWQDYRGFIKCIFGRRYTEAIADFNACTARVPYGFVMDHSYSFYLGLCYLQLNEFGTAETLFAKQINRDLKANGENWVHHLDLFYLGITFLEQKKYKDAIDTFDRALKSYPNFSDAKYYKAKALIAIGETSSVTKLISEARAEAAKGYTINEDNSLYERYPYQVNWKLVDK